MSTPAQFDPREFRNALSSFATGVTIVTARGADGAPVGVTASSFNSVSLNPPMVLWSLSKTARSFGAFDAADHWAVHILTADQDALSNRFAKSGENKFDGIETKPGLGEVPLILDCATRFQCKTAFKYEGGDHVIFVGEVLEFRRHEKPPLVFHGGSYALAARVTAPQTLSGNVRQETQDSAGSTHGDDMLGYLLWRANSHFRKKISAQFQQEKLDDDGFMVLARLRRHDREQAQLCAELNSSGFAETQSKLEILKQQGLITTRGGTLALTGAGRDCVQRIDSLSMEIESHLLGQMGAGEALAFKHMLRRFIVDTDEGLLHPWEDGRAP